jgi:ABC-type sugar transport system substrate-binding protein
MVAMLISCSQNHPPYRIGVSQCSADIWRDKQNAELQMGAYFHGNVELKFAAAYDSDKRQVQQIDSLVASGIDLLIVAPNQVQTISPAIDRAYDKGIPVIVFERKTSSRKHTAFISADNYEMGRVMGEYIVSRLHGEGTVLEIKGLEGSSPAIERHNGFVEALKKAPNIKLLASLQGDWTEPRAYEATKKWLADNKDVHVDLVFGANDRTAMGARKALGKGVLYCGIDGLLGKNGGIQLVRDSLLDA